MPGMNRHSLTRVFVWLLMALFAIYLTAVGSGFHFHVCPDDGPARATVHFLDPSAPLTGTVLSEVHHDVDLSPANQLGNPGKPLPDLLFAALFILPFLLAGTSRSWPSKPLLALPGARPHLRPPPRAPPR